MKKISKDKIKLIRFILAYNISLLCGLLLTQLITQQFHQFSEYKQILIVFLGAILAGVLSVTIFYMGKFHDYQREFIKQLRIHSESVAENDRVLDDYNDSLKDLMFTIESHDKLLGGKLKPKVESMTNKIKNVKDSVNQIKSQEDKLKSINKKFEKFSIHTIRSLLIDVAPFGWGFIYIATLNTETTLGQFFNLMIILSVGIFAFIHSWYDKEEQMSILHEYYRFLNEMTSDIIIETNKITGYHVQIEKLEHFASKNIIP